MEGKVKCKCGNEITVSGDTRLDEYSIKADGGRLEKGEGFLRVICGKCGKEAGKINFYKQVEEKD
ncbi:MAG: hypothetical protein PHQ80_03965 [Candidatus ainarchaeum sp.]|nr:hypothetical protein [Candidatus ainarchaeum sp.]MDD5096439.1 hypothetical protein [Candidatus ainarchaeum sp.]